MVQNDRDAYGMGNAIQLTDLHENPSSFRRESKVEDRRDGSPTPRGEKTSRKGKGKQRVERDEPTPAGSERSFVTATTAGGSTPGLLSQSGSVESATTITSCRGNPILLREVCVPASAVHLWKYGDITFDKKWGNIIRDVTEDPEGHRRSRLQKLKAKVGRHLDCYCLYVENRFGRCQTSCRNACSPVKNSVVQHGKTLYHGFIKLVGNPQDGDGKPKPRVQVPKKHTVDCLPRRGNRAPKVSRSWLIPEMRVCDSCLNWSYKANGKDEMRIRGPCAEELLERWELIFDDKDPIILDTQLWSSIPKKGEMILKNDKEYDLVRNHILYGRRVLRSRVDSRRVGSVIDVTASKDLLKAQVLVHASHDDPKAHGPLRKICQFDSLDWAVAMGTGNLLREGIVDDFYSECIERGGKDLSEKSTEIKNVLPNLISKRMAETFKRSCKACHDSDQLFPIPETAKASFGGGSPNGKEPMPTGPSINPDFLDPEDVRLAEKKRHEAEIREAQRLATLRAQPVIFEEGQHSDGCPGPSNNPTLVRTTPTPRGSVSGDEDPSESTSAQNPQTTTSSLLSPNHAR